MAENLFVSKRAIAREAVVYIFCVFFYVVNAMENFTTS